MTVPQRLKLDGSSQKPASMRRGVHAGTNISSGGVLWQAVRKDRVNITESGKNRIMHIRFIGGTLSMGHGAPLPGLPGKPTRLSEMPR
jgi:hypothetical protein